MRQRTNGITATGLRNRRGYVLLPAMLAFSITVLSLIAMFLNPVHSTYTLVRQRLQMHSARHLAEAGAAKAMKEIEKNGPGFTGEGTINLSTGAAKWHVRKSSDGRLSVICFGEPGLPSGIRATATVKLSVEVKGTAGAYQLNVRSVMRIYAEKD